jgi:hypothetical protein
MSSDEDGAELMAAFKKGGRSAPPKPRQPSVSPGMFISEDSSTEESPMNPTPSLFRRVAVAVRVKPIKNREDYAFYELKDEVARVLREFRLKGDIMYEIKLTNGNIQQVSQPRCSAAAQSKGVTQSFQRASFLFSFISSTQS